MDSELSNSARNGEKKFRRKMTVFGGSGGSNLKKIRVCHHKTQLLSVITYPLTIKINPELLVYANVSVCGKNITVYTYM